MAVQASRFTCEIATPLETCSYKDTCHSKCSAPPQLSGHSYKTFPTHAAYFLTPFPSALPFQHKSHKRAGFFLSHLMPWPEWEHSEWTALQAKAMRMSGILESFQELPWFYLHLSRAGNIIWPLCFFYVMASAVITKLKVQDWCIFHRNRIQVFDLNCDTEPFRNIHDLTSPSPTPHFLFARNTMKFFCILLKRFLRKCVSGKIKSFSESNN